MAFSVPVQELDGWPKSKWELGDFDAERKLLCAWGDRVTVMLELDAYPNFVYPYDEGPSDAIIRSCAVERFSGPGGTAGTGLMSYDFAVLTCRYSTRGPGWINNALVREEFYPAPMYQMTSNTQLFWDNGVTPCEVGDEPRRTETLHEYVLSFYRLTTLPAWVFTRTQVCNSNTVGALNIPGLLFAPETLLYTGTRISSKFSFGRLQRFDVTARFLWKISGWNKFWRPDGGAGAGAYEFLYNAAGTQYVQHTPIVF